MILNDLGIKLNELIVDIPSHHPYAKTPVYQIMPNHLHLIVCIDGSRVARRDVACRDAACRDAACHVSTTNNNKMQKIAEQCGLVSIAMGGMKSALTNHAHSNKIPFGWQTRFHDHIIRDQEEWERIANYIKNNPASWENDKFYTE